MCVQDVQDNECWILPANTKLSNLYLNKFPKFSSVFFFSFKSIFKASNSAANLQMKGLLKTKHHLIKLFLNDHLWFSSAKKHHAQQKRPHFEKKPRFPWGNLLNLEPRVTVRLVEKPTRTKKFQKKISISGTFFRRKNALLKSKEENVFV